MRFTIALVLILSAGEAFADTFRFNGGIVASGDSVAALVQKGGSPDRVVPIENEFGAAIGERWEYYLSDGKMVSFVIQDGKVRMIEEQ